MGIGRDLAVRLTGNDQREIPTVDLPHDRAGFHVTGRARFTAALQRPEERDEAAAAIRDIIERITLSPGPGRGEIDATLHGDFRTILEWTHRQKNKTDTPLSGVSVSVVAGAGFEPATFRL